MEQSSKFGEPQSTYLAFGPPTPVMATRRDSNATIQLHRIRMFSQKMYEQFTTEAEEQSKETRVNDLKESLNIHAPQVEKPPQAKRSVVSQLPRRGPLMRFKKTQSSRQDLPEEHANVRSVMHKIRGALSKFFLRDHKEKTTQRPTLEIPQINHDINPNSLRFSVAQCHEIYGKQQHDTKPEINDEDQVLKIDKIDNVGFLEEGDNEELHGALLFILNNSSPRSSTALVRKTLYAPDSKAFQRLSQMCKKEGINADLHRLSQMIQDEGIEPDFRRISRLYTHGSEGTRLSDFASAKSKRLSVMHQDQTFFRLTQGRKDKSPLSQAFQEDSEHTHDVSLTPSSEDHKNELQDELEDHRELEECQRKELGHGVHEENVHEENVHDVKCYDSNRYSKLYGPEDVQRLSKMYDEDVEGILYDLDECILWTEDYHSRKLDSYASGGSKDTTYLSEIFSTGSDTSMRLYD